MAIGRHVNFLGELYRPITYRSAFVPKLMHQFICDADYFLSAKNTKQTYIVRHSVSHFVVI